MVDTGPPCRSGERAIRVQRDDVAYPDGATGGWRSTLSLWCSAACSSGLGQVGKPVGTPSSPTSPSPSILLADGAAAAASGVGLVSTLTHRERSDSIVASVILGAMVVVSVIAELAIPHLIPLPDKL